MALKIHDSYIQEDTLYYEFYRKAEKLYDNVNIYKYSLNKKFRFYCPCCFAEGIKRYMRRSGHVVRRIIDTLAYEGLIAIQEFRCFRCQEIHQKTGAVRGHSHLLLPDSVLKGFAYEKDVYLNILRDEEGKNADVFFEDNPGTIGRVLKLYPDLGEEEEEIEEVFDGKMLVPTLV